MPRTDGAPEQKTPALPDLEKFAKQALQDGDYLTAGKLADQILVLNLSNRTAIYCRYKVLFYCEEFSKLAGFPLSDEEYSFLHDPTWLIAECYVAFANLYQGKKAKAKVFFAIALKVANAHSADFLLVKRLAEAGLEIIKVFYDEDFGEDKFICATSTYYGKLFGKKIANEVDAEICFVQGISLRQLKKNIESRRCFDLIHLNQVESTVSDKARAKVIVQAGLTYVKANDEKRAIKELREALRLFPDNEYAKAILLKEYFKRIKKLFDKGGYGPVFSLVKKAQQIDPCHSVVFHFHVLSLFYLEFFLDVGQIDNRNIMRTPDACVAMCYQAFAFLYLNKITEAENIFLEVVNQCNEKNADADWQLPLELAQMGIQFISFRQSPQGVLNYVFQKTHHTFHRYLLGGITYAQWGKKDLAITCFASLSSMQLEPEQRALVAKQMGLILVKFGQWPHAEERFEHELTILFSERDRKLYKRNLIVAEQHWVQNDYFSVIEFANAALAIKEDCAMALNYKLIAMFSMGQYSEVIANYQETFTAYSEYYLNLCYLAFAKIFVGDELKEVRACFNLVLEKCTSRKEDGCCLAKELANFGLVIIAGLESDNPEQAAAEMKDILPEAKAEGFDLVEQELCFLKIAVFAYLKDFKKTNAYFSLLLQIAEKTKNNNMQQRVLIQEALILLQRKRIPLAVEKIKAALKFNKTDRNLLKALQEVSPSDSLKAPPSKYGDLVVKATMPGKEKVKSFEITNISFFLPADAVEGEVKTAVGHGFVRLSGAGSDSLTKSRKPADNLIAAAPGSDSVENPKMKMPEIKADAKVSKEAKVLVREGSAAEAPKNVTDVVQNAKADPQAVDSTDHPFALGNVSRLMFLNGQQSAEGAATMRSIDSRNDITEVGMPEKGDGTISPAGSPLSSPQNSGSADIPQVTNYSCCGCYIF